MPNLLKLHNRAGRAVPSTSILTADECDICREKHYGTRGIDHIIERHCTELQTELTRDVATLGLEKL